MKNSPLPSSDDKTGWPWTSDHEPVGETLTDGSPWPRITVVTPSYNQGRFIEETIRSVLLQGYPNLEYMIIDGGSTDETVEIIKKYEPWISYWVSEKDRGQSHAINKGMNRATGDILAWLNSDDMLLPETLSKVAELFKETDADLIHGKMLRLMPDGELQLAQLIPATPNFEYLKNWIYQPSAFWKRSVWEKAGPLDEDLHIVMDVDFWLKAQRAGFKMLPVDDVLSIFRKHAEAKTISINNPGEQFINERYRLFMRHAQKMRLPVRLIYPTLRNSLKILEFLGAGTVGRRIRRYVTLLIMAPFIAMFGVEKTKFLYRSFYSEPE